MSNIKISNLTFTDDLPTEELIDYAIDWMTNYERDYYTGKPWVAEDFKFAVFIDRNAEKLVELRWDVPNTEIGYDFAVMLSDSERRELLWKIFGTYL